jgi:uncharacterized membrane protein YbjE (DUF340 family)
MTVAAFSGLILALLQQAQAQVPDKGMSSAHFVYIPGCVILGLVLGWILGARAARAEAAVEQKKAAARAARADRPEP